MGPVLIEPLLMSAWVAAGAGLIFLAVFLWSLSKGQAPRHVQFSLAALPVLGLGIAFILFVIRWGKQPKDYAYAVYPDGIAYLEDNRWTIFRWADVTVFQSGHDLGSMMGELVTHDGRWMPLHRHVPRWRELGAAMEHRICPRIYRESQVAIANGEVAQFGPFGIGRDGLHHQGRVLAWHRVGAVMLCWNAPDGMNASFRDRHASGGDCIWIVDSQMYLFCHELARTVLTRAVAMKLIQDYAPDAHVNFTLDQRSTAEEG
jgi:hypothetical protein